MKSVRRVIACGLLLAWPCAAVRAGSYDVPRSVPVDQPRAEILREVVIAKQPKRYMGWPDMVVTPSGELIVVFSGDRDWHVCPWGKVMAVRSTDGGATWSEPELWVDTPLDDRGTGIAVFPDGELFLSYEAAITFATRSGPHYDPYKEHAATISEETRAQYKGSWGLHSLDNGRTWEVVAKMPTMTPHGPTVLDDGRMILATGGRVWESPDRGATWTQLAEFQMDETTWKSNNAFHSEQHTGQAADGRLVALSRYHERATGDLALRQITSLDGGRTWTEPHATGMVGYPPHVLRLSNGWLLASYGRRVAPMGQRATISKDHGETWLTDQEIVLSNAVPIDESQMDYPSSWDLGYATSAELPDGTIWTVYYQVEKTEDGEFPSIMGTHWRLKQ